jgi:hypothetical protein
MSSPLIGRESVVNRRKDESPVEQYHSSGMALTSIGAVIMLMATIMLLIECRESEYDHVSDILVSLMILITGYWLRAHDDEDMI